MEKLLLMLELQKQLNDATNGEEWAVKKVTKNGKAINWKRCIYMECAEIIDSFAWKHWKSIDAKVDWDNVQIEIVDIMHFVLSLAIEQYAQKGENSLEQIAKDMAQNKLFAQVQKNELSFAPSQEVMQQVEYVMFLVLQRDNFDLTQLFEQFYKLIVMGALDLDSLYKLYVGKNILNQFRQDNGYKAGTYIKVWNGKEDNVVMMQLWQNNPNYTPDELYADLEKEYNKLK